MYRSVLYDVFQKYGVKRRNVLECQNGYRNEIWPVETVSGDKISVIFFKREDGIVDRINRADKASEYLAEKGFPTRRRFDKRTLRLKQGKFQTYARIYNYLPGKTILWEGYTMNHIKLLGMAMSNMHACLADLDRGGYLSVYDEYLVITQRMREYFSDTKVSAAILQKLNIQIHVNQINKFTRLLSDLKPKPDQQVLHMDFVRGNILFDEPKPGDTLVLEDVAISGILDFEKVAFGHPVMDIARTLAFLLVDCKYKKSVKTYKYFLRSGYIKRGKASQIGGSDDRNTLIKMLLLYDMYKFLRHNPYEYLSQNEHFVRTRDILSKLGVISYL